MIEADFVPYVDQFFLEAQERGLDLKKEDFSFSVQFGSIPHAAGQCRYATDEITINPNYWYDRNEKGKESLVFHELGHCILERPHDNGILDHGECKSIMKGTEDGRKCRRNLVSNIWRDYYVDELFEPESAVPDWYVSEIETEVETEIFSEEDKLGNLIRGSTMGMLDTEQNFEIDVTFQKSEFTDYLELNWGELTFSFSRDRGLISYPTETIYFHSNWTTYLTTNIRFVQLDGFHYFLVDDKMFHIDQLEPNPFVSVRASISSVSNQETSRLSMKINQLK